MKINYPKIIVLNLIISIVAYIFIYDDTMAGVKEIIFLGFLSNFLFKENLLNRFYLLFINSLFFYLSCVLIIYFGLVIIDLTVEGNLDSLYFISGLDNSALWDLMWYSYGYTVGILLQGIYERLRNKKKDKLIEHELAREVVNITDMMLTSSQISKITALRHKPFQLSAETLQL